MENDSQFVEFRSNTHIPSSGRRFCIHNIMTTLNERLSSPNLYLRPIGWRRDQAICITPNGAWSVPPSGKTNQFILICKSAKCQRAYWVNSQNLITAPGSTPPHHASRPVHGSHTVGTCYVKPTIPEMCPHQPLI